MLCTLLRRDAKAGECAEQRGSFNPFNAELQKKKKKIALTGSRLLALVRQMHNSYSNSELELIRLVKLKETVLLIEARFSIDSITNQLPALIKRWKV